MTSRRSAAAGRTRRPARPRARRASAPRRSTSMPQRSRCRAVAAPIPLEAPVMRIRFMARATQSVARCRASWGQRGARGGIPGHAVDRSARERGGAAEVEPRERRAVRGQLGERAEHHLSQPVAAAADVTADEVAVARLQVVRAEHVARQDPVAEPGGEALDLRLDALDVAIELGRPVDAARRPVGVGPGGVTCPPARASGPRCSAGRAAAPARRGGARPTARSPPAARARCRRRARCPRPGPPRWSTGSARRAPSRP